MANLGRRRGGSRTNAALKNVNSEWNPQTKITLSTGATTSTKITWPILKLTVVADNNVYIAFSATSADVIASANDLELEANEMYEIDVPWGEASDSDQDTVYFQVQRVNASTTVVKVIEG